MKNITNKTKITSIMAIVTLATIITSVSVVSALSVCAAPSCMELQINDSTYNLRGDALAQYYDINTRQIDYLGLKEQLQYLPTNPDPIYIGIEGSKTSVSDFVSKYSVEEQKSKSTDTYISLVGTISKNNLQKYFDNVSFEEFVASDLGIAHLASHTDNSGTIGKGALPLTPEQIKSIVNLLDTFEDNKIQELVTTSKDVERTQ